MYVCIVYIKGSIYESVRYVYGIYILFTLCIVEFTCMHTLIYTYTTYIGGSSGNSSPAASDLSTPVIIGIVVAVVLCVLIVIVSYVIYGTKRRTNDAGKLIYTYTHATYAVL